MPDPKALKRYPAGSRLAPAAIDVVPSDWASVAYTVTIAEHPDLSGMPILVFTPTGVGGGGGTRTSTTITTGALAPSGQATGSVALAKASLLVRAVAVFNRQCRIRLYGTSAARDADLARPVDESAISGSGTTGTGIATDLVLGPDEGYAISCDPKPVLASPADPSVTTLYYTIDNLTSGAVPVAVALYHTPLEA